MLMQNLANIITLFFLLVVLSYYFLLFFPKKSYPYDKSYSSVTIVVPAHNEEKHILECLDSVVNAKFNGSKQIIVIDDGSIDKTAEAVGFYIVNCLKNSSSKNGLQKRCRLSGSNKITLIRTKHSGKSRSINRALEIAEGDLIAIVDADSIISENSLVELTKVVRQKGFAAACCPVLVKNRKKHILMWVHLEQLFNSLLRHIFSKVNANVTTPGPLSVYDKKALLKIGGFSVEGFSEDVDVTIKLIRLGYKVGFSDKAFAQTYMPHDFKGFMRQRTRFARGLINILRRHMRLNTALIDIYTLPLLLFGYVQAVIMGSFTIYQIVSGYINYFFSKGAVFNIQVVKFFFEWLSIVGFAKWCYFVFHSFISMSGIGIIALVGVISGLLSYPLYFYSIAKFDKRFDIYHVIPVFFMFPFWLLIMVIYIFCLPEMLRKKQYNIWKKNEP